MLSKLSFEDLKKYGLNLCDLLDLYDLVQSSVKTNDPGSTTNVNTQNSTGANLNQKSDENSVNMEITAGDNSHLKLTDFRKCSESQQPCSSFSGHNSFASENHQNSSEHVVLDGGFGNSNAEEPEFYIDTDDEVFEGFAEPSEVHNLPAYDRHCFQKRILNYKAGMNRGIKMSKPTAFDDSDLLENGNKPAEPNAKENKEARGSSATKKAKKTHCTSFLDSETSENEDEPVVTHKKRDREEGGSAETSNKKAKKAQHTAFLDSDTSENEDEPVGTNKKQNKEAAGSQSTVKKQAKKTQRTMCLDSDTSSENVDDPAETNLEQNREVGGCSKSKKTKKIHRSSVKKGRMWDKKKSARADLLEEHKAFLSDENLCQRDKKEIRRYLEDKLNPKYKIFDMLTTMAKNDEEVASVQTKLEKNGVVFESDLTKLVGALMEHMYAQTSNLNLVTAQMREGLAVSLVAAFPRLAHEPLSSGEKPWSWIYDRKNNKGRFANYHAYKQKTSGATRLRGGGSKSKPAKKKVSVEETVLFSTVDDLELSKDTRYLRLIVPDDRQKNVIEDLMEKSYVERRNLVRNPKCPVRLLLAAYPHLKSFGGTMIDQEFERLFKGKSSLLIRNFSDLVPKLIEIAKENPQKYPPETCTQFADSSLNALIVLSLLLPKPKRVDAYVWERGMDTCPRLKDFFDIVPIGTDLRTFILERREKDSSPVQPFIVGTGTPKKIDSICLVLGDDEFINLPRSTLPLRAVDLLIKCNYVLATHFYLGWKYVFRFLVANVYKMPLENPSHSDSALTEQFKAILAIKSKV